MSDSDSDDYVDIANENLETDEEVDDFNEVDQAQNNNSGRKGRGPDINWVEIAQYSNKSKYMESEYYKDIKDNFTKRRGRETEYADTEHYTCKHARKVGYVKCPIEYKINFLQTCEEVVVTTNAMRHIHLVDKDYVAEGGTNFRWNAAQTDIVMNGVRNEATQKVIFRNLKDANVFPEGKFSL